jgi:hypothetical protein
VETEGTVGSIIIGEEEAVAEEVADPVEEMEGKVRLCVEVMVAKGPR